MAVHGSTLRGGCRGGTGWQYRGIGLGHRMGTQGEHGGACNLYSRCSSLCWGGGRQAAGVCRLAGRLGGVRCGVGLTPLLYR